MFDLAVQKFLIDISPQLNSDVTAIFNKLKERYGIKYKLYQDSVILNYDLINCPYPNSDIVRECRGLQLSIKDFSVISRAMNRFLNYGEGDTVNNFIFDSDTVVFDKIDGSLVILYWSDFKQSWQVRTRGTAFAEEPVFSIHSDMQKKLEALLTPLTFRDLIVSTMGIDFDILKSDLARNYSFVFELVSPENRIITPYQKRALYYIMTVDNLNNIEEDDYEEGYDYISHFVNCEKIPYTKLSSIEKILKDVKELPATSEGYVVRNSYGNRVKVKNPAYVALHLLYNNGQITNSRILELVEIGEDSEFLSYFPEEKYKFDLILERRKKLFAEIERIYNLIKNIPEQKDFALQATNYKFSGILFKLRAGKSLPDIWSQCNISYKEKLLFRN